MSDFITRNPQLRAVSMHATIGMSTPAVEILDALSKCQHLRTLSINFDNMNTKVARYLYMACNRLETLVLSIRAAKYLDLSSISIDIPSVKNLHFMVTRRMSFNDQLDVIQGFSQLNFLHWEFEFDYIQSRDVDKSPSKRRLSAKELDLFGFNWYNPDGSADVPVAKVLDYCEQVKSFKTTCLNIGPLTFQSLERHFGSLTCLLFDRCNFITSGMVQGFMASCPHLTHLKSRTLDVHDICGEIMGEQDDTLLYPKEWICLKLVRLSVPICGFYGKPVEWQRQVLQRLATLEELKYLEIGSYGIDLTNSFYYDGLDLRLGCRLKILGSLKRLKGIMFVGLKQRLEEQDIRWMLKNLSGLKYLIGTANYDMEKHMHLEMILKGTRISLVSVGGSEYGEAEYLKTNEDMWKDIESDLV
ncbi:hypothetical protein BGX27_009945 [Mortierella sp. AM989]|nr:hypothetical protein BGX27_009945 [Mortierella sp. AM989]